MKFEELEEAQKKYEQMSLSIQKNIKSIQSIQNSQLKLTKTAQTIAKSLAAINKMNIEMPNFERTVVQIGKSLSRSYEQLGNVEKALSLSNNKSLESLNALNKSIGIIVSEYYSEQTSINRMPDTIGNVLASWINNYDFEAIVRSISEYEYDDNEAVGEYKLDELSCDNEEIKCNDITITKADMDAFVNNAGVKDKRIGNLIFQILSIIMLILGILDIPNNYAVSQVANYLDKHKEIRDESTNMQKYYITTDYAYVYLKPDVTTEKLCKLPYGTILDLIEENDFWIKVEYVENEKLRHGWMQRTKVDTYYSE